MLPLLHDWIARGLVSGERYDGPWANVGTPDELASLDRALTAHEAPGAPPYPPHEGCSQDMPTNDNPLLDFSGLPRFDAIQPAHVTPAVDAPARRRPRDDRSGRHRHRRAVLGRRVVEPIADVLDRLDRAWSAVRHLNAVVNTPELRDAYNENLPKIIAFYTRPRAGPAPVREVPRAARRARRSRASTPRSAS